MKKIFISFLIAFYIQSAFSGELNAINFKPDENKNGVRDDLDRYISEKYKGDETLISFLLDYTSLFQKTIIHHNDKSTVIELRNIMSEMFECLSDKKGGKTKNIVLDIQAEALNTFELSMAYIKSNGKLSGRVYTLMDKKERETTCPKYFPKEK